MYMYLLIRICIPFDLYTCRKIYMYITMLYFPLAYTYTVQMYIEHKEIGKLQQINLHDYINLSLCQNNKIKLRYM